MKRTAIFGSGRSVLGGRLLAGLLLGGVGLLLGGVGCAAQGSATDDPFDVDPSAGAGGDGAMGNGGSAGDDAVGGASNGEGGSDVVGPDEPPMDATAVCGISDIGFPGLRRLSRRELETTLRDVFPALGATWASTLSADGISHAGFDNDANVLLVSKQTARELAATAESVAEALVGNLAQALPCAAAAADAACAGEMLDTYGRRLFRRPLTPDERQSFLDFWQTARTATGDFAQSIGWLARGLLESPHFVYRREIGTPSGERAELDQFEIATELSYAFAGTTPSDALLDRAAAGVL
jgi:hypothetical protein